jgi:preprotein translocase SecE subunit
MRAIIGYFQGVIAELKKVQWPTAKTVLLYFLSVVVGLALATVVVWAFDFIFIRGLGLLIGRS